MALSNITIPSFQTLIPVDTRTNNLKVLLLPTVSTNSGQLIFFKDYYGTSSNSTFTISTTGTDLIDDINWRYTFSNAFGSMGFVSDGLRSWRTIGLYDGALTPSAATTALPLVPGVRYSFLPANYSGSGPASNVGSNSAIGSATVTVTSYTSASPSFVSLGNYVANYILSANATNTQTLVMIAKFKTGNTGYTLDARSALGSGFIYSTAGGIGGDWTSGGTYYKDTVLTSMSLAGSDQSTDNQWHHFVYQRAAWSGAVTFLARFSLNESAFSDCAEIMMFTQALTLQQVKDNFNFFAPRFGWTPVS
jgi:hypothetical protein